MRPAPLRRAPGAAKRRKKSLPIREAFFHRFGRLFSFAENNRCAGKHCKCRQQGRNLCAGVGVLFIGGLGNGAAADVNSLGVLSKAADGAAALFAVGVFALVVNNGLPVAVGMIFAVDYCAAAEALFPVLFAVPGPVASVVVAEGGDFNFHFFSADGAAAKLKSVFGAGWLGDDLNVLKVLVAGDMHPLGIEVGLVEVMCGGKFIHIAGFIAVAGAVRFGVPAVEGILIKSKAEEAVSSYLNFGSAGILAPEGIAYGVFRACAAVAPIDNGVCTLWLPGGGIGDVFGYGVGKIGSPCFELPAGIFGKVALECRGGFAGFYGIFFGFKGFAGNAVNIFYGVFGIDCGLKRNGLVWAFALFRLFDIWKPWPVHASENWLPAGWGIMLDDILAGLMAMCCMLVLRALGWV